MKFYKDAFLRYLFLTFIDDAEVLRSFDEQGPVTELPRRQFLAALGATLSTAAIPLAAHSGKRVKLGVCANAATFPKVLHYGFDYIEPAAADIATMSESAFGISSSRLSHLLFVANALTTSFAPCAWMGTM